MGRGLATEAARAVISQAFEVYPDLVRVRATADAGNVRSHRVLEKVGMVREEVLRQNRLVRGELLDEVWYGILGRSAWVCLGQLDEAQPNTALHPTAPRRAPVLICASVSGAAGERQVRPSKRKNAEAVAMEAASEAANLCGYPDTITLAVVLSHRVGGPTAWLRRSSTERRTLLRRRCCGRFGLGTGRNWRAWRISVGDRPSRAADRRPGRALGAARDRGVLSDGAASMTVAGVSGSGSSEPCQHSRRPNNSLQPTPRGDILTRGRG
jgi:hypothetical protein